MKAFKKFFSRNPLAALLVFLPATLVAQVAHASPVLIFILASIAIIPMAAYIGESTESLAHFTGPRIGGLLNATLGNAAELIITITAIRAGLLELVKASITGSIIGNLLLVMGASMLFGGLKNGLQTFDRRQSGNHAVLLILAVLALVIPSFFGHSILGSQAGSISDETAYSEQVEALSLGVA